VLDDIALLPGRQSLWDAPDLSLGGAVSNIRATSILGTGVAVDAELKA
jgi:hypothetical protein